MNAKLISLAAVAAFLLAPALSAQPVEQTSSPATSATSAIPDVPMQCNDGIYRFLPGQFNFCAAGRDMQRGRVRSAQEMLKLSASWGSKPAQFALGIMYFNGEGVPVDHARGLVWLTLAAERHDVRYLGVLKSAYNTSSPAEHRVASALLADLRPTYTDSVAAVRGKKHFERAMRELRRNEVYDAHVCISGLTPSVINLSDPFASFCPPVISVTRMLDTKADRYFDGWDPEGHVTVGKPQPVEPPSQD